MNMNVNKHSLLATNIYMQTICLFKDRVMYHYHQKMTNRVSTSRGIKGLYY